MYDPFGIWTQMRNHIVFAYSTAKTKSKIKIVRKMRNTYNSYNIIDNFYKNDIGEQSVENISFIYLLLKVYKNK